MPWTPPARVCAAVLVAAALGMGGCGSSSTKTSAAPTGDFAGRVAGSQAFVAVVAGRAKVVAYVCDGRHGLAELFGGQRSGNRLALRNAHGARLSATITPGRVTGAFAKAAGGSSLRFTATPAHGHAGFFRARGRIDHAPATLGWIVLPDGAERGAATLGSRVVEAPALNVATSTATLRGGGTLPAVRISTGSGSLTGQQGGQLGTFGG